MSATLERLRTLRRQAGQGARDEHHRPASPSGIAGDVYGADDTHDERNGGGRRTGRDGRAEATVLRPSPLAGEGLGRGGNAAARRDPAQTIDDLRRLLRVRAPERAPLPRGPVERTLPGIEITPGLRLIEHRLPWEALPDAFGVAFARREGERRFRDVLCFDTETTGLAGGTGTRAFLIGAARWDDDGFLVRQWLMTALQAEHDLLAAFARDLRDDTVLVSYNGRSYDAPLLAARFRLARLHNPLPDCEHLDLLHPARRRWRGRWENCRLATIERRVLGIVREDDLPGSEAPAAWLQYLRGGPSRNLCRVAEHNRQDLVSLAGLLVYLSLEEQAVSRPTAG